MSNITDIQGLLLSRTFRIPPYQRDYSWTRAQVDDLFSDIQDALDQGSKHFLGTIVLSDGPNGTTDVVDGQQRLTTVLLVVNALLNQVKSDTYYYPATSMILLRNREDSTKLKIDFGRNALFVRDMLAGDVAKPVTRGQRLLMDNYELAHQRALALKNRGGDILVKSWINTISSLEIIAFSASDTGRAIRMFQTVNDRGLPLSMMDKAKALLVLYSSLHLEGSLDAFINDSFGECFKAFDTIKEFVRSAGFKIQSISRESFTDDDLMRYHYLAYSYSGASSIDDYDGSSRTVFDAFLKGNLKSLANSGDQELRGFILDYVNDLREFATAFCELILEVGSNLRLYKLFVILGLSTRLYPLIIRMFQRGRLESPISDNEDMLAYIETCDVRVYKTRGTDPGRHIGDISHSSRNSSLEEIAGKLREFVNKFMTDSLFGSYLESDMYSNAAVTYILIETHAQSHSLTELIYLSQAQITREHMIAQTPNWAPSNNGFSDLQDFLAHVDTLGNLTLLTGSENSRLNNLPIFTKISDTRGYASSEFRITRALAQQYAGQDFGKSDIRARTAEIRSLALRRWPIWKDAIA